VVETTGCYNLTISQIEGNGGRQEEEKRGSDGG
jgi:hypothetical protein